jgi:FAD/FMN-containing dehydrogenase
MFKHINRRSFMGKLSSITALTVSAPFSSKALAQFSGLDINELEGLIKGTSCELLHPGNSFSNAKFKEASVVFNKRLKLKPEIILKARDIEGMRRAIDWAKQNNVKVRMRSGGHSYEGFSVGPGIIIDVRPLNKIIIDHKNKVARVGAGARLIDLITELYSKGFAIPTGTCPTVGVAGLALGGGVGMTTRKWGLTCDQLKAVHILLENGEHIRADKDNHSEIFWACRGGGGGHFGVVTHFEFNLQPKPTVYTFSLKWKGSQMEELLKRWQEFNENAPREISSIFKVTANSKGIIHTKCVGQIIVDGTNIKSEWGAKHAIRSLTAIAPEKFYFKKRTYMDSVKYFGGKDDYTGARFKAKSHYAKEALNSVDIKRIRTALRNIPSGSTIALLFDSLGGAVKDTSHEESAFAHRDALYSIQYYCQWYKDSDEQKNLNMMRSVYAKLERTFGAHSYINYCDLDLKEDWGRRYFGNNLERLLDLKRQLDPENVFDYGAQCLSRLR